MNESRRLRRVVVTGMGIVSCIGTDVAQVLSSLREGRSGISFIPEYAEMGFRSQVAGKPVIDLDQAIDRKLRRFMGDGAAYLHLCMEQAIADAGLSAAEVSHERTGIIVGSGGPSTRNQVEAARICQERGPKRVGPYMVPRCMSSTTSATAATNFRIHGVNYTISSACSTSAHCIGNAAELIQWGKQDVMFAAAGEHHVLQPEGDLLRGRAYAMRRGGAGRGDRVIDALDLEIGGQVGRHGRAHAARDLVGPDAADALAAQRIGRLDLVGR